MTEKEARTLESRKAIAERLLASRHDDRATLARFQMTPIAAFGVHDDRMYVRVHANAVEVGPGVYAFVVADRVIRVGSAAGGVIRRLADDPLYIDKALARAGFKTPAPLWEAELWVHVLRSYGQDQGEVWGRPSVPIACAIGPVPARMACKAEEYLVAERFAAPPLKQPLLNRSSRRS